MSQQKYDLRSLNDITAAASAHGDVVVRAKRVAEMIREASQSAWVGIFEISGTEARAVGWTGAEVPAFMSFPITRGITRDVVKGAKTIHVSDVMKDPRYLVGVSGTRSEVIAPVMDARGAVIGTLEVDANTVNAFNDSDVQFVEQCAGRIVSLFEK